MKLAAIDIGSNAVRLLLSKVIVDGGDPIFKKESFVRIPLRLGEDTFGSGRISDDKTERLVETMIGYRGRAASEEAFPAPGMQRKRRSRTPRTHARGSGADRLAKRNGRSMATPTGTTIPVCSGQLYHFPDVTGHRPWRPHRGSKGR